MESPIQVVDFSKPENLEIQVDLGVLLPDAEVTPDSSQTFFIQAGEKTLHQSLAEVFLGHRSEMKDLARYTEIIELCPCATFVDDDNGQCVLVNAPFCQIFGCSVDDVTGDGWQKLIDPQVADEVCEAWGLFVSGEADRFDRTCGFIHAKSKEMVFCRVKAGKVNGGSGFIGFVEPV